MALLLAYDPNHSRFQPAGDILIGMRTILPALLVVTATQFAHGALPKVLFSGIQTSATSDVPGYPGVKFNLLTRIYASPNGNHYVSISTNVGSGSPRVITTGDMLVPNSLTVRVRETEPWIFGGPYTTSNIRSVAGINDSGNFGCVLSSSEPTSANEYSVKRVSGVFGSVAKEGDIAPLTGAAYPGGLAAPQLLDDNSMAWGSGTNNTGVDAALFTESVLLARRAITIPNGQLSGTPVPIMRFETDKFRIGSVDSSFMYQALVGNGTVTASGSSIVAVDNEVKAQVGYAIPGSTNTETVTSFGATANGGSSISAQNRYFTFSGALNGGQDFVYQGKVGGTPKFVFEGDPITPGNSELWGATTTTFSGVAINSYGETVICGLTNNPDTTKNYVVVLNNGYTSKVMYRRFDPIDLDSNGIADDDLFFQSISSDNLMFCDNNRLFLGAQLRTTAGTLSGTILAHIWLDLPITGDVDGSGEVDAADIDMVIAAFGSMTPDIPEDVDGSGEVDAVDIDIVISNFGRTR